MADSKPARPPQVTLAGWLVVAGSVVVAVTALAQGAELHSLETREAVEEYVSSPPGDQLGLSLQGGLMVLRVLLSVAAAAAAATAVLGWYALQRSKRARLALTVLVVPLFLAGFSFRSGGVFPAMVTAAVVMLWFQPGRDWFNGVTRAPAPRPLPPPSAPRPPSPTSSPAPPTTSPGTPSASPPWAAPPGGAAPAGGRDPLLDLPPPTGPPLHPTPYAARATGGDDRALRRGRPPSVVWACVLTWLFAAPAVVLFGATLVAMAADPQQLVDELRTQNPDAAGEFSDASLRTVLYATSAGVLVWSVAAIVLGVLVWRRVSWAAPVLMVSVGAVAAFCLVGVVAAYVLALPLVASAATLALLLRPETRAWLRRSG